MTDTVISDGFAAPHDEGLPSISDGSEDWGSAGIMMMLGQAVDGGSYVRSDSELTFTGHDGTNDEVDVTPGVAYLDLSGETVEFQSTYGGSSPPAYDATLPTLPAIMVLVPTTVTNLAVADSTTNDVWLAYATDGSVTGVSAGDVWVRHGSGLSAPAHPSVKLGTVNPDDASADALDNRFGSPTFGDTTHDSVSTESLNSGIVFMDPDATDFAVALEDAVSRASTGNTVVVPTDYSQCSGAVVNKPVTIRSLGETYGMFSDTMPTVTKTADAPVIEGGSNVAIAVKSLKIDASGLSDTTPDIVTHGKTLVDSVTHLGTGSHGVHLLQEASGENLNLSRVVNISGKNVSGDLVHASNTTANASQLNSLRVHVQIYQNGGGWAINTGPDVSNASEFFVNTVEGAGMQGVIRFNSQRCRAQVLRHEGEGPVAQFEQPYNSCEIAYDATGNRATFNNSNNLFYEMGASQYQRQFNTFALIGQDFEAETAGKGYIVSTPDGTARYRIRVDNSGNVVTDSV